MKYTVPFLAALASGVAAHGGVGSYTFSGKTWAGFSPYNPNPSAQTIQRAWYSYDPIMTPDGVNIRCNNKGTETAPLHGEIAAGTDITATWAQWTHAEGPVTVYLARCPDSGCTGWDGSGKVWFKIDEAGLLSGTINKGEWGNGIVLKTLKWTTKIPATLKPGNYLIRHEVLALHQARTPQFYPECAQLTITGTGSDYPDSSYLVSFPGAFKMSDPGVTVEINSDTSSTYIVPGPPVWKGGSGSAPVPVPTSTSTVPVPTATSSVPTATPSSGTVAKWGQCGGNGYSGPTGCVSGSTCVKLNDYYSQCQ